MIVVICILGGLVLGLTFTTLNLLKKNEKQEDILMGYLRYLDKLSHIIEFIDGKLKEIDHKGSFEADDEIGFFFEEIQNIQKVLNEFKIKNLEK
tara:strand:- start:453 stop:734 length:282 start_codon:yes stop_codon:yes gene_type:complete